MTTYAGFVSDLVDMSVTGQTSLSAPPASITGKTPVRWPMPPSGDALAITMGGDGYQRTMRVELRVAVQALGQGTLDGAYASALTAMDNLDAALQTLNQTAAYGLSWTITMGMVEVGDTQYYGLTCAVTAVDFT